LSKGAQRMKRNGDSIPHTYAQISLLLFIVFIVVAECVEHGQNYLLKATGLISLSAAIPFIILPFYLLAKYGSVEKGKTYLYTQQVVTRGLYGIVRHPQYLGYMFLVLGFMLIDQNWLCTAIGAVIIVSLYMQARAEEEYLVNRFGKRYLDYTKKVPRFNFLLGLIRLIDNNSSKNN